MNNEHSDQEEDNFCEQYWKEKFCYFVFHMIEKTFSARGFENRTKEEN